MIDRFYLRSTIELEPLNKGRGTTGKGYSQWRYFFPAGLLLVFDTHLRTKPPRMGLGLVASST